MDARPTFTNARWINHGASNGVVFPLPNGNAIVLMRPVVRRTGPCRSSPSTRGSATRASISRCERRRARCGPECRINQGGDSRLLRRGRHGDADHVLTLWDATFLCLHYRLRPAPAAPPRAVAAT